MTVFFAGRQITSPAVVSAIDDSAMQDRNVTGSNVLGLIGPSTGGQPNVVLSFTNPDDARTALVSGDLLDAVVRSFAPSSETSAPAKVEAIRVNPATQATLALKDGTAATVINLTTDGYGQRENQCKVKVEAGTSVGQKVTTQRNNDYYIGDNLARNVFKIRYSGGQASAVMTIDSAQCVLQAPSGTTVATILFSAFPTVQQLVDRINAVASFAASVQDANGQGLTANGLDAVTAQDVKTADYVATANLQAVVDWFNSTASPLFNGARAASVGTVPASLPFTYAAGGSDGTITNTEWTNAFGVLQTADVQWISPISSDPSIHAMAAAHCLFMSTVGQMERRFMVGTPLATTDAAAVVLAKALNTDLGGMVNNGGYDYDPSGLLTLYPPYIVAAMIAAGFCGLSPGEAMTNKSLSLRGMERNTRNPTDSDVLLTGGVIPVSSGSDGFRVVQSRSMWLNDRKFNRTELSCGAALDFTSRAVRAALSVLKGGKGRPERLTMAVSLTESVLTQLATAEPNGPGVLAGDPPGGASPAFKNIVATLVGDVIAVTFQCSPVIPTNFITITIHSVPFSGSATA